VNGAADLGGMMGFGPVIPEPEAERFHAEWERRVLAMVLAMGAAGRWTIDASRFARESLPPSVYLSSTYYSIWTMGLERLLVAAGMVGADELEAGRSSKPGVDVRSWSPDEARAALAAGFPYARPAPGAQRFSVGDAVRTRVMHPVGHTRLPRYARGKAGVVERVHGAHVLPDASAHGAGEQPQWLYSVRFTGRELWGPESDAALTVTIDAWESYLEVSGNSAHATVV
jgi:nitrile hydratase subunit beta